MLISDFFQGFRRLVPVRSLFIAVALCVVGQVNAAAPDLTAGGVPNDNDQWNLGPTGMAGWCYREGINTTNARQFQVKSVAAGSPAAGIMIVNDVILGASGTGADPVNFTMDARIAFAQAITDAEERSPATLKILRWRSGATSIVPLTLETLGAYSATAPYNCPKSAAILEKGLQYMMATNASDGNWGYSALTLLAANDPVNSNNTARQAKATAEMRGLILTPDLIAQYTSGKSMGFDAKPWHIGPKLIALSEYYLKTGDPDVLPSIRAYAHCVADGQSFLGTCGHFFSDPGFRNNPVNGPYNIGYGPINNAALPCYIGLILANKCGLTDPEILAGIQRAGTFYAYFTHLGCAGYGEHLPYEGHDTNGKAGLQALAFELEGDRLESTKYYARASTAAAIAERDIGHTGSFFAFLYAPLGANVGGPDAMAYYFRETRWMYELARRWDGSFVYNSFSSGGVEVDALYGQGNCLMATPMLLTYAMPLRQTYLTGKNQNPANWITPAEMPEVSAASAHIYNAPSRTTTELLSDLGSWSPKVRRYAARELKLRTADRTTILSTIHAMAANESATMQSRNGACAALGEIGDTSSVPVLLPLVTNANFVVRFGAASALASYRFSGNGTALKPYVMALMQACITNQRPLLPLDTEDPMQTVNGNLCNAIFAPFAALHTHDLVGLDRQLLYGAMRVCAANPQADVRKGLSTIYPKLTKTDLDQVADVFVNIAYDNAPAGMGIRDSRLPAISYLQANGKSEGVPLAVRFAEDIGTDSGGIVDPLNVLVNYAGSSQMVIPDADVDRFCEILIASGAKYGIPEAQAVLDAIAADSSPKVLTPFKAIDWIFPDDATLDLPKKWTVLRASSKNYSNPDSVYTWRKLRGAGAVSFSPNGTGSAKDTTVVFDGTPGQYLFEVKMTDSHGLTEVSNTVAVTLRNSGGTLPPNSPPTANAQSLTAAQGTPTQVILTGADPEGYALNYTVTTGPTHGSLSGTAPNLVYTAAANYTGADSIRFKVEDSEGQFAIATVNITVNTAAPVGLAIYEPFNYPVGNLNGATTSASIGLTGTWTAGGLITTESPSLSYGTLSTNGNRVRSGLLVAPGGSRSISSSALKDRSLLDNGATLWFSVELGGFGGWIGYEGNVIDLALANNSFPYGPNIPNNGSQPGTGLGLRLSNTEVRAAQFYDAAVGAPLTGTWDNTVTGNILSENPRLVVGKITWGATSDTVEIYLAEQDMVLPTQPSSVLTANVDQSTFNILTFSRGRNVLLDEIRFGATLQSVLQGTVAMSADVTPPTPNPMTFVAAPAPASSSTITMTATPALDGMGVEYYFTCTAGGGNSSGWQNSNIYTDSGLTPGVSYSYTVKTRDKYPALNETAASAAASATIPALGTVPGVEGLPQALAQSLITNAALSVGTVTQSASYSMTVPAGSVLSQSPPEGNSVAYASPVNMVISIGQNPVLPVLTPASIVDNRGGETVELGTQIIYTLTFSKDIDAATLNAGDFINFGDVPVTIGAIAETSPGVVTVTVTPTGFVAGNLRFAVAAGAVIKDTLGNDLNTLSAIIDDTAITVIPVQPKTQIFTGTNNTSNDNWNTATNWNTNSGPIPSGTDNVSIPAGKQVTVISTSIPTYEGNLTLGAGASLQAGYTTTDITFFKCLGTAGKTTIAMGEGVQLVFRGNYSPIMPAINLQGNSEINMGASTTPGTDPVFNYPISGPYTLTLSGKSDCVANLNVASNFGQLRFSTQYLGQDGLPFTVNANTAGSLGGNVTVGASYITGGKGANLIVTAANAMSDTATLSLYGNTGSLVTFNANDTIGGLKLNGVKQLPGTYTSSSGWLAGTGTLTVTGPSFAYWNPSGGPSGTWDDSNIWNNLANLTGSNSAWSPGQIAEFNASGTYGVTLGGAKEIGGLVVSNGSVTLSSGELSLSSEAPVSVASGASLTLGTVISQNDAGLGLHKSGAGTLVLSSENTFTGPVAIGAGTLSVATLDDAGAPSALGQYPAAGPGGLIFAGGTLRYTGGSTSVDRGFTFTGSSTIDISNANSSLTLGNIETGGPGTLTATGGAGSSLGLGNIKIIQGNNITLNPNTTTMSVASVEGYSAYPIGAIITLGGSSTGNVVTGSIYASVVPGSAYQQGTALVKSGTGDWRIAGAFTAGAYGNNNVTVNEGTLILAGNNTFTGNTNLNNNAKLVLDFAATDTNKLSNSGGIFLTGGILELKGGSHVEVVLSTTLKAGPTSFISRNGGTAKLRMNAITRSAGSTISFLDGTVADTDLTNTNGILGGFATTGADWAVNSTNGADGAITALSSYTAWTSSGGSATANYLLSGSDTLTGALAVNSLKIANTGSNQTLDLGANNLTITSTSATALGGVLYSGGYNGKYTINGTGGLLASSTTGELVMHTRAGTLTVNTPVVTSGATAGFLTKSGNGSLVLGGTNVYTGTTRVASGKLFVNGSLSSQNAGLTVDTGATLGGSGTLGRNVTVADGGKLEFNLGAPAASHIPLTRSSSRTFAFSGSSVLTITSNGGAAPGLYTLISGGNNITGSAPATVILPPGWTADPPVISTNALRINITAVAPPINSPPVWSEIQVTKNNALEDTAFSATLLDDASDPNDDPLTFTKLSGPTWLSVAANGTLSGTPTNSNVGANLFTVSVSDGIAAPVEVALSVPVTNANDAPVWNSNPLVEPDVTQNGSYSQNIATAASDVDAGTVLTFAKVSGPSWLNVATNGTISGTPSNADVGLNVFTVSVSDGIAQVEATLNITVININDSPFWTSNPVVGANATQDLAYTSSLTGSAVDVDAGASLTFTKLSGPSWLSVASNGTLSGLPTNNDVGVNSFTVSVSDGIAAPVTGTLVITVINVNDAPVAFAQSLTMNENTVRPITLAASDIDGNPLTYSIVVQPAHGTLGGTAPNVTYTPNENYKGPDGFTFKVNDGTVDSAVATVSITVTIPNEVPVALTQSVTTNEDTALPVTLAGTDADNNPLTYLIVTQPANGTLIGTAANVTYTPNANYNGSDSFTFKVNDGLVDSPVATVSITVTSINDAPVFTASPTVLAGGRENISYTGQTLAGRATDVDAGDTLNYSKISGPSWLVVAANGAISGTPPSGSAGLNSFVVRATDSASAAADATLEITISIIDPGMTWDANGSTANRTDGAGVWLTANQWWNGSANQNWTSSSSASFGSGGTGGAVTLASATSVNNLVFNSFAGTYTLGTAGNAITLNGVLVKKSGSGAVTLTSPVILGCDQTWVNQSAPGTANAITASAAITGGFSLNKEGTGHLILLSATNAYGNARVMGGTLRFGNTWSNTWSAGSLPSTSNIEINNGIVEAYFTLTRTLGTGAGHIQLTGGRSGFTNLQGDASGNFLTFSSTSTVVTWGSATFNPGTLVLSDTGAQCVLRMPNPFDLNGGARTVEVSATGVGAGRGTYGSMEGNLSGAGASLLKTGVGTLLLNGTNTYNSGTIINGGGLWFNKLVTMPNSGTVAVNDGGILSIGIGNTGGWTTGSSGNGTIGGLLSGLGGQSGGAVSYSGNVNIGLNVTGTQTYSGTIANVGTSLGLHIGNKDSGTSSDPFTATGTIILSGNNSYTGLTAINRGTVVAGHANALGSGNITFNGGTLQFTGSSAGTDYASRVKNSTAAVTLNTNGENVIMSGVIDSSNTAGLTKMGTGNLSLGGSNTYTGTTTVSEGKLFINGSLSNISAALTVNSGASLGGTGTIGRNLTIAAGGKLEFNLSTPATNHDRLDISSGRSFAFSGASELTITSTGGASAGTYTLVTGGNNISGVAPATLNLPAGWAATVSISGNSLVLNVTSVGGPGPVDHFAISSITSPQAVGTAITGITITAQDASNATATSFTGTVTFGGITGITGTSASFVAGVLSGVSVIPTVAGTNLTFTVNDGAAHIGSATFTVQTQYQGWAGGAAFDADANGDGIKNGLAFLFGASGPSAAVTLPTVSQIGGDLKLNFNMLKPANRGSATISVQHSSDLGIADPWTTVPVTDSNSGPTSGVTIVVTPGGGTTYGIEATVSSGQAAAGKLFGRLQANP